MSQILPQAEHSERRPSARLVGAALLGLLCTPVLACSSDADDNSEPHITSSQALADVDAANFQERCDARSGTVEVIAHCGGLNTCKGFSYDVTTGLLSEHTCKGAATCAGWNCLID